LVNDEDDEKKENEDTRKKGNFLMVLFISCPKLALTCFSDLKRSGLGHPSKKILIAK
jgi:hypothetical protein